MQKITYHCKLRASNYTCIYGATDKVYSLSVFSATNICLRLQVYICNNSMLTTINVFTATSLCLYPFYVYGYKSVFTSVSLCLQQFYGYSYKSVFQATDLCLQLVCVYSYNSMFTATILRLQLQICVRSSEPALCSDDLWQLQSLACGCDH